jgi:acetylornithine deacetylase/succinyl-diaminopimelate desuccinylase-like protein
MRDEVVDLLRRLVACDTSNPPGRETQAAAILEEFCGAAGLRCERVAKDPDRTNLIVTLPGRGTGPSLAFLGHLDVVEAHREEWSEEPFAAVERDGAVWGRGTVDMKCQVAATAVALATLARDGFTPNGDLMLLLMADEELGEAEVGAPWFVEQRPDLRPDYVIGEGSGERFDTPAGPLYLLDCGVKATCSATVTVKGRAGDASLGEAGENAIYEMARLLGRLAAFEPRLRVPEGVAPLLDVLAPGIADDAERVERARAAHPALGRIVEALTRTIIQPTVAEATGPPNQIPHVATIDLQVVPIPGTTQEEIEAELREALGPGSYELEVDPPEGGLVSPHESPLRDAIEAFLAEHDPEATLVPCRAYGYSDCDMIRKAYGSVTYGFIPFPNADPLVNLESKHGADERVLIDDLVFQAEAARSVARRIGSL